MPAATGHRSRRNVLAPPASPRSRSSARVSPAASSPVPPTSPAAPPRPDLTLPPAPGAIEPSPRRPSRERRRFSRRPPRRSRVRGRSLGRRPPAPSETPIQREVADAKAPVTPADVATDPVATTPPSPLVHPVAPVAISPAPAGLTSVPLPLGGGLSDVDPAVVRPPRPRHAGADPGRPPRPADPGPAEPRAGRADPADAGRRAAVRRRPSAPGRLPRVRGSWERAARPTRPVRAWAPRRPRRVRRGSHRRLQRASASAGMPLGTAPPAEVSPTHELGASPLGPPPSTVVMHPRPCSRPAPAGNGIAARGLRRTPAGPVGHRRGAEPDRGRGRRTRRTEPGVVDVSGGSTPWTDASSALDAGQVVVARAEDPAAVADSAPAAAVGGPSGGGPPKAAPAVRTSTRWPSACSRPCCAGSRTSSCWTGNGEGYAPTRGEWLLSPER